MRTTALVLSVLVAACAGAKKREPIPEAQLREQRDVFYADVERDNALNAQTFLRRIADKYNANPDQPVVIDVLALSGGGANGAFGTGYLRGWGEIKDGEFVRPQFDLVTGISTGALISPFVFSGTEKRYEEVDELYRNPGEDWAVKRSWALLSGGVSLLKGDQLWDEVRTRVDGPLLTEVADGRRENRMMLIGTIDADLGMQRVWNGAALAMDAEKSGDPSRLHDVIIASASYPGAFPAVEIDGHLHVDGGMGSLFVAGLDSIWLSRASAAWRERIGETREPPRIRIWVVINNRLRVPPTTMQPTWLSTMGRGLEVGGKISTQVLVAAFINGSKRVSAESGWPIELRYVAIPDEAELPKSESAFDKAYMRKLSDIGRAMGRDPKNWQTDIPKSEWPRDVDLQPLPAKADAQ